ncbi:MAG: hypothetical protein ACTSU3_06080 [Candidatus Thorarchaeota archaeon]
MPLSVPIQDKQSFSIFAKGAAFLILVSLSVSAVIPYGVYTANLWDSTTFQIEPEPVVSSTFSNLTDHTSGSVIFQHPYSVISEKPLVVVENYSFYVQSVSVTYDEALQTARDWLASVGPSFIIWDLLFSINSTAPPSWTFRFSFPGFTSYVIVETVTGSVIEFEIAYLNDFDPTPLTLKEAEKLAYEFLVGHNISIPETARYIRGLPYDCQRFYSLVFQEYVGPVRIETSGIVVRTSAFTRGVSYFKMNWFGLDDIDLSSIIHPDVVQKNAQVRLAGNNEYIPEVTNNSDIIWEMSELTLVGVIDPSISNSTVHRLAWVTNLHSISDLTLEVRLYSDPYSSNLFGFRSPSRSYTTLLEMSTFYSTELLLGSSIVFLVMLVVSVSTIGSIVYKRRD